MIDYILLAEFDDLKGKVVRYCHPKKIEEVEDEGTTPGKYKVTLEDKLAEMIIPDTGNDRMIDSVFFMINRPKPNQVLQSLQ